MPRLQHDRSALTLRPIAAADVPRYRALRLTALQQHPEAYGGDYAETAARTDDDWHDWVRRSTGNDRQAFFVAEAHGELVAATGIYRESGAKMEHTATLVGVYVRPDWRGLGITDDLIARCVEWARASGVYQVRLAVVTTNAGAIRCYARCGFVVYGLEPAAIHHAGTYHDELLMIRRV